MYTNVKFWGGKYDGQTMPIDLQSLPATLRYPIAHKDEFNRTVYETVEYNIFFEDNEVRAVRTK
jgi:hypothetical protein